MTTLQHECTRVPVTALNSCGALLVAAEGPFLRFYHRENSRYIASERVFTAQAVHGITVYSGEHDELIRLVVWGGRVVRALEVSFASTAHPRTQLEVCKSDVARASDWILDLAPRPSGLDDKTEYCEGTCVAVTAHNALLQVAVDRRDTDVEGPIGFSISITELTSSSRSILYSAHVLWESANCVLVAAGTAFGEIIYWSWAQDRDRRESSMVHRVFLGHEGSIFGVRISKKLSPGCCQKLKRIIASCSDDRTIRIWDISDVTNKASHTVGPNQDVNTERTRHTGFSNAAFDIKPFSSSECLAIGWGHASRVWTVQFLESTSNEGALFLLSTGEDASSRTWRLDENNREGSNSPCKLVQQDSAAYHNGKNIWSSTIHYDSAGRPQVVCGAADAKITIHRLISMVGDPKRSRTHEFTVFGIMSLAQLDNQQHDADTSQHTHRSSKMAEFFRSYCFLDHDLFLLTTNSGKVLIGSLNSDPISKEAHILSSAALIDQLEDLSGYSVSTGEPVTSVAFVAGSKGVIYMYSKTYGNLSKVSFVTGKIGEMFAASFVESCGREVVTLLFTIVGQREARLLYVDVTAHSGPEVIRTVIVPVSEQLTGAMITSMAIAVTPRVSFLHLGFRRGSVAIYSIQPDQSKADDYATLFRVLRNVHGDETVTTLVWRASIVDASAGHLISAGKDGCLAMHHIDLCANSIELVHNLTLPIGPNIEGIYFYQDRLLVHGFSSKKWVLYDVTSEEEIMSVETGGAHRSWAFQPHPALQGGGTLVWTRASSMHICSQSGPNHRVVRPGGHGREIKTVAVSAEVLCPLIATGAEDTDIKIFEYNDGELLCQRTLRKHTTGIQHLQWSHNGEYLFSSGGCEEFYIWRIRQLPSAMGIGVVCESVYTPKSEHSDLRITSFDVKKREDGHDIAMVFSDSSLKVYRYSPSSATKWLPLAKGLYFTSCLMQCIFLSSESILTVGTDGYTTVWPLSSEATGIHTNSTSSALTLNWQQPIRIHQSSSKAMISHFVNGSPKLVISGGDDGSLSVLLMGRALSTRFLDTAYANPPVICSRAHASAITACVILMHQYRHYVLTSGNDQWIRLWEVHISDESDKTRPGENIGLVSRVGKIKTNVADVSSMAVLAAKEEKSAARVLICGVGMEVVRIEWDSYA